MKLIVYHASYGCDTGCCGHIVQEVDTGHEHFEFLHPYGADYKTFAEHLIESMYGKEHIKDLDWENCEIYDS
jgi:hypothetical protein